MTWLEIAMVPPANRVESLSEAMTAAGALAVTLSSAAEDPLFEPAPGEMPLWQATTVTGLFSGDSNERELLRRIREQYPAPPPSHRVSSLRDRDWERVWLDRFAPRRFGQRLWVRPAQLPLPESATDAVEVILDPGLAFGTGSHASTALCLQWLDAQELNGRRLLDYGCGSGILAIAGIKLGAQSAVAVDIDPQALAATAANAAVNSVERCLSMGAPEVAHDQSFDLVVANILANPLMSLARELCAVLPAGGRLCLAGILQAQADTVADAYAGLVEFQPQAEKDGWVRLAGIIR